MSLAITHFVFGATMTALTVAILASDSGFPHTTSVAGGIWAMLPDVHFVSPVARDQIYAIHGSVWADLFWFHYTLDRIDPDESLAFATALVGVYLVAAAFADRRHHRD